MSENIFPNSIDIQSSAAIQCVAMKKQAPKSEQIGFRPKPQDKAIIQAGQRKHGVDKAQIIRMALRRFAEAEGIVVRAS